MLAVWGQRGHTHRIYSGKEQTAQGGSWLLCYPRSVVSRLHHRYPPPLGIHLFCFPHISLQPGLRCLQQRSNLLASRGQGGQHRRQWTAGRGREVEAAKVREAQLRGSGNRRRNGPGVKKLLLACEMQISGCSIKWPDL